MNKRASEELPEKPSLKGYNLKKMKNSLVNTGAKIPSGSAKVKTQE